MTLKNERKNVMGEKHRSRKRQITLRFDEKAMKILDEKVKEAGTSREQYIRDMISSSEVTQKKRLEISDSDYEKLMTDLHSVGDKINQIARNVNARGRTEKADADLLQEYYYELIKLYEDAILQE